MWQTFERTLAKKLCHLVNFHSCKWPNIDQIMKPSVHTGLWVRRRERERENGESLKGERGLRQRLFKGFRFNVPLHRLALAGRQGRWDSNQQSRKDGPRLTSWQVSSAWSSSWPRAPSPPRPWILDPSGSTTTSSSPGTTRTSLTTAAVAETTTTITTGGTLPPLKCTSWKEVYFPVFSQHLIDSRLLKLNCQPPS